MFSLDLIFLPKIRLGMLMNVMLKNIMGCILHASYKLNHCLGLRIT